MPENSSAPESSEAILLSLGSNIEPHRYLVAATKRLASDVRVVAASAVFRTTPVGGSHGPTFLNAALLIHCDLTPGDLKFGVLRPLEQELGRVRSNDRNAPRTIDVDISLFGQRVVQQESLQLAIPDPDILTQAYVAVPLADLAPSLIHPVADLSLQEIVGRLDCRGVERHGELVLWSESDRF